MPPTAVVDKTLREKAPGKGGKIPPDLVVFVVVVTVIPAFFFTYRKCARATSNPDLSRFQ